MEKQKQVKRYWKTLAIIFIILFVLETLFWTAMIIGGTKIIEMENDCAYNVCKDHEKYYYDDYEEMCYCYDNNMISKTEYMGNK